MFDWNIAKSGEGWRKDYERLLALKNEVKAASTDVPVMKPYLSKRYAQQVERIGPSIKDGVSAEFSEAIDGYKKAAARLDEARRKEASRWDIVRLGAEKAAIQAEMERIRASNSSPIGGGDRFERLQRYFGELMQGDEHRQRAAAEIFQDAGEMGWQGETKSGEPIRYRVSELVTAAKQALPALRVTDEMIQADQGVDAAQSSLHEKHLQVLEIGQALGDDPAHMFATGALAHTYKRVIWGQDGNVAEVLEPDDPRVTGVDLSKIRGE